MPWWIVRHYHGRIKAGVPRQAKGLLQMMIGTKKTTWIWSNTVDRSDYIQPWEVITGRITESTPLPGGLALKVTFEKNNKLLEDSIVIPIWMLKRDRSLFLLENPKLILNYRISYCWVSKGSQIVGGKTVSEKDFAYVADTATYADENGEEHECVLNVWGWGELLDAYYEAGDPEGLERELGETEREREMEYLEGDDLPF